MPGNQVQAIRRLKHEYCYRIDDGDYEGWVELFTEDGEFTSSTAGTYAGRDELYEFASEDFDAAYQDTVHVVSNPVIDVDGDEATGRWYLVLLHETHEGEVGWAQTTYDDEYRMVDGEWKVASSVSAPGISTD